MKRRKVLVGTHWLARILYIAGFKYGATSNIADELSLGYGKCDDYGFWQFELILDMTNRD